MSYQVLARKWRPANFSEVAGQSHVLKSLINALDNQRLHHAYLFTGTRGVGKTTLARILAKCLNCEQGVSSTPCGQCSACVEIREGRFIDLIEVDAASRTKVEDTRELLENVQYTPARGRFKVYLIDEVHMLSNHSFNALLKTLEEPPDHVKFLFATTDPQKLPVTILSRCLQFNLKNLSPDIIVGHLTHILKEEGIACEEPALWQLAAAASGSMRDALTLVDQAIAYCQGEISAKGVIEMLGVPEQQQVIRLLQLMAARNISGILDLVNNMAEQTADFEHTLDSLLASLHRVAIAQVVPAAVDNSFGDRQEILSLAAEFSSEDIQLYFQIGTAARRELGLAGQQTRAAFEMLLLRMLVFSPEYAPATESLPEPPQTARDQEHSSATLDAQDPAPTPPQVPEAQKKNSEALTSGAPVAPDRGRESSAYAQAESVDVQHRRSAVQPESVEPLPVDGIPEAESVSSQRERENPEPDSVVSQPERASPEPESPGPQPEMEDSEPGNAAAQQASEELNEEADIRVASAGMCHADWLSLFPSLQLNGIAANVLANCQLDSHVQDTLHFTLDQSQSAVYNEDTLPRLNKLLSDGLGRQIQADIKIGKLTQESPSQQQRRLRQERRNAMIADFEQDENVKQLLDHFSAAVAKDSITPIND